MALVIQNQSNFDFDDKLSYKHQLIKDNDIFIDIFGIITKEGSMLEITKYYGLLKMLNIKLAEELCNLKMIQDKTEIPEIYNRLEQLKKNFILSIETEITINGETKLQFVIFINDYFDKIDPAKDLDYKFHNENSFCPDIDTSGFYSGIEKDWILRMTNIEILYQVVERENEINSKKNSGIIYRIKDALGWNSKKSVENLMIEDVPVIIDNEIDNEIDNINILDNEEVFLPEPTESEPLLGREVTTVLESRDMNEFGEPHHLEIFFKNDTTNDVNNIINMSSTVIISSIVPILVLIVIL